ncbi:unnamed protein product [Lota lota]
MQMLNSCPAYPPDPSPPQPPVEPPPSHHAPLSPGPAPGQEEGESNKEDQEDGLIRHDNRQRRSSAVSLTLRCPGLSAALLWAAAGQSWPGSQARLDLELIKRAGPANRCRGDPVKERSGDDRTTGPSGTTTTPPAPSLQSQLLLSTAPRSSPPPRCPALVPGPFGGRDGGLTAGMILYYWAGLPFSLPFTALSAVAKGLIDDQSSNVTRPSSGAATLRYLRPSGSSIGGALVPAGSPKDGSSPLVLT